MSFPFFFHNHLTEKFASFYIYDEVHTSHHNNNKVLSRFSCIFAAQILLIDGNRLFWFILIPIEFIVLSPLSLESFTSLKIASIVLSCNKANPMVWVSVFHQNMVTWFLIVSFKPLMKRWIKNSSDNPLVLTINASHCSWYALIVETYFNWLFS